MYCLDSSVPVFSAWVGRFGVQDPSGGVGGEEIFLFSTRVQTGPGVHPGSFVWVKQPGHGVKHSVPSNALCVSAGPFRGDFYLTQKQIISTKSLLNSL